MARRAIVVVLLGLASLAVAAILVAGFVSWSRPKPVAQAAAPSAPAPATGRKITATLYYVAENGLSLVGVQREIPFGEPIVEQARRIVEAQLGDPPPPLASAIPQGTKLRALFLTETGDAFLDMSGDVSAKHTGGARDELFTVYALVDALTVNLPAITRVQILIEGKEADTLAGHVDLRHPLQKNLKWIAGAEPH